jgi:hypothetical protein
MRAPPIAVEGEIPGHSGGPSEQIVSTGVRHVVGQGARGGFLHKVVDVGVRGAAMAEHRLEPLSHLRPDISKYRCNRDDSRA